MAEAKHPREVFPIAVAQDEPFPDHYLPKDALAATARSGKFTGMAGLLLAAVQSTMARENVGAFGIFRRFGGTIALFTAMGGTYAFVSTASANLREKNDAYNAGLGGFCAGALVGLRNRAIPSILGNGLALGVALSVAAYTGGAVFGERGNPTEDKFAKREEIRKRYRRPVNETINEIGEGRGIYGPGYEERRARRIKEAYGIDVPQPFYKSS